LTLLLSLFVLPELERKGIAKWQFLIFTYTAVDPGDQQTANFRTLPAGRAMAAASGTLTVATSAPLAPAASVATSTPGPAATVAGVSPEPQAVVVPKAALCCVWGEKN
jgi:hypothetical protein